MNKFILSMIVLLVIAGCTITPQTMRQNTPEAVFTSSNPPKKIALCIAEKWEEFGPVNQRETINGYSLSVNTINGYLFYLVDIKTKGNVSVTKSYDRPGINIAPPPFLNAVEQCQI